MVNDVGEFWPLGWIGWGYPQSSSIDRWIFHETNHPAFGVFLWLWKPPNVHQGITPLHASCRNVRLRMLGLLRAEVTLISPRPPITPSHHPVRIGNRAASIGIFPWALHGM